MAAPATYIEPSSAYVTLPSSPHAIVVTIYSGSVSGLLENAKGCVWNCTVQNAEEARLLEANYSISSKQYVENGIHMKVLSKGKPNENCVLDNDITLEDAYIYLTNS